MRFQKPLINSLSKAILVTNIATTLFLISCKRFEVPLTTPDPIKIDPIDVKIRLDVYQHGENLKEGELDQSVQEVQTQSTNRIEEIQKLKDARVIGENHQGLLAVVEPPSDETYKKYSEDLVEKENKDRIFLMKNEAQNRKVMMHDIQKERWKHESRRAFPGEHIEQQKKDGKGYEWVKKTDS